MKTEGKGEIPVKIEKKIINFVKKTKNLGDTRFHNYVERMGISPHEAEEVVYRELREMSKKRGK